VIDLGWLLAFALQHSGMVRDGFKRIWTRLVPARLERSLYAALAGLLLLALPVVWQPVPGEAWWRLPRGLVVVPLLAGLAQVLVSVRFDHATMFGLRQAWAGDAAAAPDRLIVAGPYRFVRHPIYAGMLAFLWTQPIMTPTLGLLVVGLSVYIGVGVVLEERDLLRRFGPAYAAYRRCVPCLLPWKVTW
jgi:protein-S-isoprenylcysteine O-methyltransferase Ste14